MLHVSHSFLFLTFTWYKENSKTVALCGQSSHPDQQSSLSQGSWEAKCIFSHVIYCHCQLLQLCSISDTWMDAELLWSCNYRKTKVLGENPVPVLLCLPQITHGVAWDCTWACVVRGLWLTAWEARWNLPMNGLAAAYKIGKVDRWDKCV